MQQVSAPETLTQAAAEPETTEDPFAVFDEIEAEMERVADWLEQFS